MVEYILIVASYFVQLRCFLFLKNNIEKDLLYYCKSREKKNAVRKNICYSDSIEKLKGEQKEIEKNVGIERKKYGKNQKKVSCTCLYSCCDLDFLGNLYANV